MMTSWKEKLQKTMARYGESLDDMVSCTLTVGEMVEVFDDGFGCAEGRPFTVWTENSVYFPVGYDGREWVGRVSRNPDGKPTQHQGGG